jgi:hypothetical protein
MKKGLVVNSCEVESNWMCSVGTIVTWQSKCPERQSEGLMRGCSQSYIVPKDTCFHSICKCVFFVFLFLFCLCCIAPLFTILSPFLEVFCHLKRL